MLVEVLGRSYDIGVKCALGANRLDICKEFATEAATLALLGGVAGVGLSALVISQLSRPLGETFFYGLRFVWQPLAALLVLGVAVVLGALLGFFPALRATLAKPVEALGNV
jgi:ABC-type antimicrobial peptide transport system permease subunit